MAQLTEFKRKKLIQMFLTGKYSLLEIAIELGITPPAVSYQLSKYFKRNK